MRHSPMRTSGTYHDLSDRKQRAERHHNRVRCDVVLFPALVLMLKSVRTKL